MPLDELESRLGPLFQAWKRDGRPRSSLGDYIALAGIEKVSKLVGAELINESL